MIQLQADLEALAQSYPPPAEEKLARRMKRLERMTAFYTEKALIAPERQAMMFVGFVSALEYAMVTIKNHRALARKLNALALEQKADE